MKSKIADTAEEQMKREQRHFKKKQEEKPLDFEKQKKLVAAGIQKTL